MKSFKYKNLLIFLLSIFFAFFVSKHEPFHRWLLGLGEFGYVGAFVGGILYVSTFTVSTGIVILFILAESLSPIKISIIAGLGAALGDLMIFLFIKDHLTDELIQIYNSVDHNHRLQKILYTKYFSWLLPVVGAIIVASPLPDEIGVSLMGISKMKTYKFIIFSFVTHSLVIFLLLSVFGFIKP